MSALGTTVLSELRSIVGPSHVLEDRDVKVGYERDITGRFAGTASAVVRPADTAQVAQIVSACSRAGVPVVVQGGNTGLSGGAIPFDGEVVVSLRRLVAIQPIDAPSGQVSVGAGVTLEALQEHARASGLRFPVDHAARSAATIGGMVATNAGGPLALRHGTMRNQVVGLEVVLGDGRVMRRMEGLLKDNAGYDFTPTLVGSEGTLAVVTAARLRLSRDPSFRLTALLGLDSLDDAVSLVSALRPSVEALEAADFFTEDGMALVCRHRRVGAPFAGRHPAYLVLEVADDSDPSEVLAQALEPVESLVRDIAVATDTARRAALWSYREGHNEAINLSGVPLKVDVSVAPAEAARFAEDVGRLVGRSGGAARLVLYGHLGDGNVHVNVLEPPDPVEELEADIMRLVSEYRGSINAEHGVGRAKVAWLHYSRSPDEIALMRSVKRLFDPAGILGPGRVFSAELDGGPSRAS
jgi:FAD/FMN-containing dehydrogenase